MASEKITVTVSVRLPWWWMAYIGALKFFHDLGVLRVDVEAVAQFVIRHASFRCDGAKKVDVKTRRYFERAPLGHHICPSDLDLDRD
jgi:hypothetical protein